MDKMEPTKDVECTLVDLLDRILDKGVIINADVIITVAGIPLVGINLRAALAGIETMLDYGMMEAWDESIRKYYAEELKAKQKVPLLDDEKINLKSFGSHYYCEGIYSTWRHGCLYVTNKRVLLFRKTPPEILIDIPLEEVQDLALKTKRHLGSERKELYVLLENNRLEILHTEKIEDLKKAIEKGMAILLKTIAH